MRLLNRLLALLLTIALIGTAVVVIAEVIVAALHHEPTIINWHAMLHWAERNTWRATSVELACAITAAAGLVLLVPQLVPRRVTRLPIEADEHTDAALTRKGLATAVRGAVWEVEGVLRAKVKVGRRHVRVKTLAAAGPDDESLQPAIEAAADGQLRALRLDPCPRLRVRVVTTRQSTG